MKRVDRDNTHIPFDSRLPPAHVFTDLSMVKKVDGFYSRTKVLHTRGICVDSSLVQET